LKTFTGYANHSYTIASNPFDILSPEQIKTVAFEVIDTVMKSLNQEFDGLLDGQREKLQSLTFKLTLFS
jgi:hypothetical protein